MKTLEFVPSYRRVVFLRWKRGKFINFLVLLSSITYLNLSAGCSAIPDDTLTSSVSIEAAYPNVSPARKAVQSGKSIAKPVKVASNRYLGRAPYICTPSGFGRTSSCFLRR